MKKLIAILTLLALCACLAFAEQADSDAALTWALDDIYVWGMTEADIAAQLPGAKLEKEAGAKLTYLEPDDYDYIWQGLRGEIEFGLKDGSLALIQLSFDDRVSALAVRDALVALYGEGTPTEDVSALAALCDAGEIDLTDDDPLTFEAWSLGDGTQILMITDAKDDEADVVFYQPPIAQ